MIYKFKCAYTKLGIGTAPSSAPVCTVVDSANNKLADTQATTALANLPGVYLYSYDGAAGLDLIALFHTTDATMDAQDLYSYTPDLITTNLDSKVSEVSIDTSGIEASLTTIDGIVDAILEDTGTTLDGIVDAILEDTGTTLDGIVDAILEDTGTTLPALITSNHAHGSGAIAWTYNLVDNLAAPIPNADVWVTSDIAGTLVLASGLTDALGNVIFYLDAGTIYVWAHKSGFNFSNPDTEVVP